MFSEIGIEILNNYVMLGGYKSGQQRQVGRQNPRPDAGRQNPRRRDASGPHVGRRDAGKRDAGRRYAGRRDNGPAGNRRGNNKSPKSLEEPLQDWSGFDAWDESHRLGQELEENLAEKKKSRKKNDYKKIKSASKKTKVC